MSNTLKLRADCDKNYYLEIEQEFVDLVRTANAIQSADGEMPEAMKKRWGELVEQQIAANAKLLEQMDADGEMYTCEQYYITYAAQDYIDNGDVMLQSA